MLEHRANPSNSLSCLLKTKPYEICNLGLHMCCINTCVSEIPWLKTMLKILLLSPKPLKLTGNHLACGWSLMVFPSAQF